MEQGLKIILSADGSQVTKTLADLQSQLKRFQDGLKNASGVESIGRINRALEATQQRIKAIQGFKGIIPPNFASNTNAALGVTGQFNQLLRETPNFAIDARIGILSLSNNLPYFIEALQRSRASGQGFMAILTQLGKGLFSVTGIATIAVTAFVAYSQGVFGAKKRVDELKKSQDEAAKATEDYISSLSLMERIRLQGEQNAQKELISLQQLYQATQNAALSIDDRRRAVNALQEQYPRYFADIKDEIILAGGAKDAYDKLTNSILASANARAAQEELDTKAREARVADKQRLDALQKEYDAQQALNKVKAEANKQGPTPIVTGGTTQSGQTAQLNTTDRLRYAQINYNKAVEETTKKQDVVNKLLEEQRQLSKEVTDLTIKQGVDVILGVDTKLPKITEPKKIKVKAEPEFKFEEIERIVRTDFLNPLQSLMRDVDLEDIEIKAPKIDYSNLPNIGEIINADQLRVTQEEFAKLGNIGASAVGGILNSFDGLTDALLNGGNALQSFGEGLQQTFQSLIKQLIKAAALAGILSLLSGGKGGLSFMAAFKTILGGGIPGLAQGGIVPKGYPNDSYLARLSSNEAVIPLQKLPGMINHLGGGKEGFVASADISGDKLVLLINRVMKSQGRAF